MKRNFLLANLVLLAIALLFTACPKEPEVPGVNLDGTWILFSHVEEEGGVPAHDIPAMKMEVTGKNFVAYQIDSDSAQAITIWWSGERNQEMPPVNWSSTPHDSGKLVIDGNNIDIQSELEAHTPAVLSADKKKITVTQNNGIVLVFEKQ